MNSLFWYEKYRPNYVHEIIGQDKIKNVLQNCLKNNNIPHLLFFGYSGVGKSIIISNFVKEYYGKDNSDMVLQLNSINERGIKIVRERINNFSKKSIPESFKSKGINHKLVILEDAETITNDAQTSLRRCIENYSYITRFCIICNDKSKIIEPIISRCCQFYFNKIKSPVILQKLEEICQSENINYERKNLNQISQQSDGDLRKAIITLQTNYYLNNNICDCLFPKDKKPNIISEFIKTSCNCVHQDILTLNKNILSSGYNLKQLIIELNEYIVYEESINISEKEKIIYALSNSYKYISYGSHELIQLMFLSYIFYKSIKLPNK